MYHTALNSVQHKLGLDFEKHPEIHKDVTQKLKLIHISTRDGEMYFSYAIKDLIKNPFFESDLAVLSQNGWRGKIFFNATEELHSVKYYIFDKYVLREETQEVM